MLNLNHLLAINFLESQSNYERIQKFIQRHNCSLDQALKYCDLSEEDFTESDWKDLTQGKI